MVVWSGVQLASNFCKQLQMDILSRLASSVWGARGPGFKSRRPDQPNQSLIGFVLDLVFFVHVRLILDAGATRLVKLAASF